MEKMKLKTGVNTKTKAALFSFALFTGLLFVAGAAHAEGPWLPENVSLHGEKVDSLYRMIFYMTSFIFFAVQGTLIYFVVRYREKQGQKAMYFHESTTLEIIWWVIPGLILFFLAVYQYNTWVIAKIATPSGADAVRVEAMAQQFAWNFRYPGPDGKFSTPDDVSVVNQLHIPEGKPVVIQLQSQDVIHSFYLPFLRVKQDAVPGMIVQVWFQATKTGTYEIACAELCGMMHWAMRGELHIHTQQEFNQWLSGQYKAKEPPARWGWEWQENTKTADSGKSI